MSALWSNPSNWSFGGAPHAGEVDVTLTFDQFVPLPHRQTTNDIPNLTITEIDFLSFDYTLSGDAITLKGDTTVLQNGGGIDSINLGLNLANSGFPFFFHDHVFTVGVGSDLDLNGPITGASADNGLHLKGTGILTLANSANSYQGTTLLEGGAGNQGTLALGANNAVPASSAVELGSGATFDLAGFNDTIGSLSDAASGAGNVHLGGGTLTTGANNASTTFDGFFGTGTGGLTKIGAGTFTAPDFEDYSGPTSILGGTLVSSGVGPPVGTNATAVTVAAGATWDLNGGIVFAGSLAGAGTVKHGALNTGFNNQSTTFSGVMQNVTTLQKFGTGTFTMTAVNAYTGSDLAIHQGTLRMGGDFVVNGTQFVFVDPGATFDLNNFEAFIGSLFGGVSAGGTIALGNGILVVNPVGSNDNFNGVITGSVACDFVKAGSETLILSGPNTYSGVTSIEGGTLKLGANNAVPANSLVRINSGAAFELDNFDDTIGALAGNGFVGFSSSLTTGGSNLSTAFLGDMNGFVGHLTKIGTGTMTINNAFEFGTITVAQGVLVVNGKVPNSDVIVNAGATLEGTGIVKNIISSGTVHPGVAPAIGTLQSGDATFNVGAAFTVALDAPSVNDRLSLSGAANLSGIPTLNVQLNFPAAIGDTFVILTASTISGLFKAPDGTLLDSLHPFFTAGGARFEIFYNPSSVVLRRVPGPATQYLVSTASSIQAGTPFDVTVTALDPANNVVYAYGGTVHFTTSDPSGGTLPADYKFTLDDQGVHTFAGGATLFTAGDQTITVTDAITGISSSATVTVTPAPAVAFAIAAPANAPSGSPFDITVTAQDPYGNIDTNYQGTVTLTSSDSDPGVVLPASYTFQPSDAGSVTFAGGVTLITPGDQTITATDTVSGITGSTIVTVTAGPWAPPGNRAGGLDASVPRFGLAGTNDGFWDWISNDQVSVG